jgi:hypothetical protein
MNAKHIALRVALGGAVLAATAFASIKFPGWERLGQISPYIVIARCKASPQPTRVIDGVVYDNPMRGGRMGGVVLCDIEITSVLKGENVKPGSPVTLWSKYWPSQGDSYLLFANVLENTNCQALDLYRVVPLGHDFPTNSLEGKTLDEQVKFMLQWRLFYLNRELEQGQEEKKRLEEGLKQ